MEGLEQLIGGINGTFAHDLLAGHVKVFEKDAADGPEVWLSFSPQLAGKTKLKASPLTTSRMLEDLTVEFPAHQALDRCCAHPSPSSHVVNF